MTRLRRLKDGWNRMLGRPGPLSGVRAGASRASASIDRTSRPGWSKGG